jgi:hypothetical protein
MARENKRNRDERRYGKLDRLIDKIPGFTLDHLGTPLWKPSGEHANRIALQTLEELQEFLASSHLFVIDNVSAYYYGQTEKVEWDVERDFPNCRPPFDRMFLESKRPPVYMDHRGTQIFDASFPEAWGISLSCLPWASRPETTGSEDYDKLLGEYAKLDGIHSLIKADSCVVQEGIFVPLVGSFLLPIDVLGKPLARPQFLMNVEAGDDVEMSRAIAVNHGQQLHPALLAIAFMNCKNVSVDAVTPDARVNRERRNARLKPFLRYHTINIEPMKVVLKTEGAIESNGLEKALHICRGHFATYTGSMLGRKLDEPVTVWRPSHIRGSAKQGVVVADYKVSPPRTDASHTGTTVAFVPS